MLLHHCLNNQAIPSIYYQEDQLTPSIERDFNQDLPENGWVYCNADTMILGEVLLNATGFDAMEFGDRYLFSKIGMTADWWRDGKNNYLIIANCQY